MSIGTVPYTNTFSEQDAANVVGYNDLLALEANATGVFPGGNANIGSLMHFKGYYQHDVAFCSTSLNQTVTIRPYSGNRLFVLFISTCQSQLRQVGTPTLNGVSFTQAGNNNGNNWTGIWYMTNPPVGNYLLSIPNSTSKSFYWQAVVVPYDGSLSAYSNAFQSGSSASPSLSANTPGGNSIVAVNLVCNTYANIFPNGNDNMWIDHASWVSLGYTAGRNSVTIPTVHSKPKTFNYTILEGVRNWQLAAAVFSVG